jgi:hypothetical protein
MNHQIKVSLIALSNYLIILNCLPWHRAIALSFEENVPACYMRNSQGQLINLGKLCRSTPSTTTPVNPCVNSQTKSVTAEQIVVSRVNYDGNILIGQVKNTSCQPLQNIKVNYQVLDTAGNVIDNGYITVEPNIINPGGQGVFQGQMQGAKVETTHVEWSYPS